MSILCLVLSISVLFPHLTFVILNTNTIEVKFGKFMLSAMVDYAYMPYNLGICRNLDEFFGGFYGFFWWLPTIVDHKNDGKSWLQ